MQKREAFTHLATLQVITKKKKTEKDKREKNMFPHENVINIAKRRESIFLQKLFFVDLCQLKSMALIVKSGHAKGMEGIIIMTRHMSHVAYLESN